MSYQAFPTQTCPQVAITLFCADSSRGVQPGDREGVLNRAQGDLLGGDVLLMYIWKLPLFQGTQEDQEVRTKKKVAKEVIGDK